MKIKLDKYDMREAVQDYIHKKLGDAVYIEGFTVIAGGLIKNPITVDWDAIEVELQE